MTLFADAVDPAGITLASSTTLVATVTVATAAVFGLALLPRPSRATVTWAAGFGISMIATYIWLAATEFDSTVLRALSSGLILCFEPLMWLGVRFYGGRRSIWLAPVLFLIAAPAVLVVTAGTDAYPGAFRAVGSIAAVFAGLSAWELFRLRIRARDVILPLALISAAFVVVAVFGIIAAVAGGGVPTGDESRILRDVNGIGIQITSMCAAITIVTLVRSDMVPRAVHADLERVKHGALRSRLDRAALRREVGWSLFVIRLDDPADLMEASGPVVFGSIIESFQQHVGEALPAGADLVWESDASGIALIQGSDEATQHQLRGLLEHISEIEDAGPSASVRVSASVGWAGALDADYDLNEMLRAAEAAADLARERGGDRWERASEQPQGSASTLEE